MQTASTKPQAVNSSFYTTEEFPEIIGFCDKDPHTHVIADGEESYEYKLNEKKVYVVKKHGRKWEIVEFFGDQIVRVSTNNNLGLVLSQALTYVPSDHDKQEERVSILIPINKEDLEKAIAVMYYLGGYPANFLPRVPELQQIMERFLEPNLTFLAYSYVPAQYLPWLNEELRKVGLIGQEKTRTIVMYKK